MKIITKTSKVIKQTMGIPDLEISGLAIDDTIKVERGTGRSNGNYIVGYLIYDECAEDPFTFDDGLGTIYRAGRNVTQEERRDCFLALGLDLDGCAIDAQDDPDGSKGDLDAVILDCYEHGCQKWSVHGHGTMCAWDTSRGAGVWVPNSVIRPELEKIKDEEERRLSAIKYAEQALDVYNAWLNGEVYGVVVNVFDAWGKEIEGAGDSCCGYYGADDATAALLDMMKALGPKATERQAEDDEAFRDRKAKIEAERGAK